MALELQLDIVANATQARAELRNVEQDIKKVESANQSSTTWWQKEEDAIAGVSEQLQTHRGELSRTEQAAQKLESATSDVVNTTSKLSGVTQTASSALSGLGGGAGDAAAQLLAMTGAAELGVGTLTALAGTIGVVVAAGIAFAGFLADSAKYYVEHGSAAKNLRTEIDNLGDAWTSSKLIVGQALIQPEQSVFIGFLKAGQEWALGLAVKLATDIELAQKLYNLSPGGAFWQRYGDANDIGPLPNPAQVLGGAHPAGSYLGPGTAGLNPNRLIGDDILVGGLSGSAAQQIYDQQQAELKRQAQEAKRLADAQARLRKQIDDLVDAGVAYKWGFPSTMPGTKVDMAAAGFNYYGPPDLPYKIGSAGLGDLGFKVDTKNWLDGLVPKQSLFGQVTDSLASSGGALLTRLLGSRSNNLGGYIGGDLASGLLKGGMGKTISGGLTSLFGKTAGGLLGGLIPFGGELLGTLLGKLFGPTQYQQDQRAANSNIAQMWASLNSQYGGNANQALSIFGFDTGALHGSNYQGAMGQTALSNVFSDLQQKQGQFNTSLGDTLTKIKALGGGIPAALQPYLDKLKDANVLTQDNIDLLGTLSGDGKPTYDQMTALQEKYNLTIDQMGPTFQKQKLDKGFQDLIDDMDMLARGGVDVMSALTTIGTDGKEHLTGLGQSVEDLVQQSQKFGYEIPNNMKPYIQKLIDSKQLLGDNGQAIEDINSLKFGGDLQTSLDTLNSTLKDLIDALKVKLPDAISAIPRHVDVEVDYHENGRPGGDGGGDPNAPGFAGGTQGYRYFGSGTMVKLHGWEKVTPRGQEDDSAASRAIAKTQTAMLAELQALRKQMAASQASGDTTVVAQFGTQRFEAIAASVTRRELASGRARPRVAPGRS